MVRIMRFGGSQLCSEQIPTNGVAMARFDIGKGASRYEVSITTLNPPAV